MRLVFVVSKLSLLVLSSIVAAVYPQITTTGKGEAASLENPVLAFGKSHSSIKTAFSIRQNHSSIITEARSCLNRKNLFGWFLDFCCC